MERANARAQMHERVVGPDKVRQATAEAPSFGRDEVVAPPGFALDIGKDLSALLVDALHTRRTGESHAFEVSQEIVRRRRPRAPDAPNGPTDSNDVRVRAAGEGNLVGYAVIHAIARSQHIAASSAR